MNKTIFIIVVCVIIAIVGLYHVSDKSGSSYQNTVTSGLPETPTPLPTPTPTPIFSPSITSTTHAVTIQGFAFNQSLTTVKRGDTVVWTNKDSVSHTVTGDGGLSSPNISSNGTYSFKFNTTGTFSYHCSIHSSMTGTVTVTQ